MNGGNTKPDLVIRNAWIVDGTGAARRQGGVAVVDDRIVARRSHWTESFRPVDFDGDGRMDIAILVHGGAPILLRNTSPGTGHWIAVRLRQTAGNTAALGAIVQTRTGSIVRTAQVGAGGTYLSQSASDLHFGLGDSATVDEISITWPDGVVERHLDLPVDQLHTFTHTAE